MDFNIGVEDAGIVVLQELWNKAAFQAMHLARETRDVVLEKDSFKEFSRSISELSTLLLSLDAKKVEDAMGSQFTNSTLRTLTSQLKRAHKIVQDYKSGSHFRLLLHSHSILLMMQELAKEIATTISSFQLANLDMALNLKTMTNQIINNLTSMELRSAATTESIASEIESIMSQNNRNRENAVRLVEKIAEAVGASANTFLVQNELMLLKREKEEMEDQKKQADALQLSQLIQLLYSTEMVTRLQNEETDTHQEQYLINSFVCPLCKEIMADPVAIFCGHSFERTAIQDHFNRGEKYCPTCQEELPSLELTPNVNLRSSVEEWKQKDMQLKFQAAVSAMKSNDICRRNKALEDLQILMVMPQYAVKVAEEGLIPKFVEFLKESQLNTKANLKCLYFLAKHSDNHKEAIIEAGVVRRIVKQLYRSDEVPDALAVLLELSTDEILTEKIGNTRDCIPLLVSLLENSNLKISQEATNVLNNLSSNTSFVVKMAEAGYMKPFVARFNQEPQESRAKMADDLLKMQVKEHSIKDLKDRQFICSLIQMLSSNNYAFKLVSLKCIKKLMTCCMMEEQLLTESGMIPPLLGLISFTSPDLHLKQEAGEILALLVKACPNPRLEIHLELQELQSEHNISLFLKLVVSSDPPIKIQFLHLLVELSHKSNVARDFIRSNIEAVAHLISSLDSDSPQVKRWTLKLIDCISDGHPEGVPLPPSPGKEMAINTLVAILTRSLEIEERSLAAAIISQLPKDDIIIDGILHKSETLKAIGEVICRTDEEGDGVRGPTNVDASLLENALAALLRFTEPTKPQLQREVGKLELYPSLVRVLSRGSSLAKKRTAIALGQLSQSTSLLVSDGGLVGKQGKISMLPVQVKNLFPSMSWCCSTLSESENLCVVHGAGCSPRDTFCLVKADAVKPLVRTLRETETDVAEAALTALETLLMEHSTASDGTGAIVESEGVVGILQVLEKGSMGAQRKALDVLHKIVKHREMSEMLIQRAERILIQLLGEDELKKKVALVLRQMKIIPEQSSYF